MIRNGTFQRNTKCLPWLAKDTPKHLSKTTSGLWILPHTSQSSPNYYVPMFLSFPFSVANIISIRTLIDFPIRSQLWLGLRGNSEFDCTSTASRIHIVEIAIYVVKHSIVSIIDTCSGDWSAPASGYFFSNQHMWHLLKSVREDLEVRWALGVQANETRTRPRSLRPNMARIQTSNWSWWAKRNLGWSERQFSGCVCVFLGHLTQTTIRNYVVPPIFRLRLLLCLASCIRVKAP